MEMSNSSSSSSVQLAGLASTITGTSNWVELRPFNMRNVTMAKFAVNEKRALFRAQALSKGGLRENYLIQDPDKSTALLRQLLQDKINSDIDSLLHTYYDKFFKPAFDNIRNNLKDKQHCEISAKQIFRDILGEAQKMYEDGQPRHDFENTSSPGFGLATHQAGHRTRGRPARAKPKAIKTHRNGGLKAKLKVKSKPRNTSNEFEPDFGTAGDKVDDRWDLLSLDSLVTDPVEL